LNQPSHSFSDPNIAEYDPLRPKFIIRRRLPIRQLVTDSLIADLTRRTILTCWAAPIWQICTV